MCRTGVTKVIVLVSPKSTLLLLRHNQPQYLSYVSGELQLIWGGIFDNIIV